MATAGSTARARQDFWLPLHQTTHESRRCVNTGCARAHTQTNTITQGFPGYDHTHTHTQAEPRARARAHTRPCRRLDRRLASLDVTAKLPPNELFLRRPSLRGNFDALYAEHSSPEPGAKTANGSGRNRNEAKCCGFGSSSNPVAEERVNDRRRLPALKPHGVVKRVFPTHICGGDAENPKVRVKAAIKGTL